jgi:LPS export ABC transporter protein LptC
LPLLNGRYMIEFFMRRSVLVILSLLAISLLSYYLLKGEKGIRLNVHQEGESFIEGLKLVHRKNGGSDWVLTAKRADISEDGNIARLSGVAMTLRNEEVTVYADKGLYNMADKNFSAEGRVIARGKNYSIISENGAEFNGTAGSLKTDGHVTIEGRKFSVQGTGMDTADNGQIVRLLGNVKAVFDN